SSRSWATSSRSIGGCSRISDSTQGARDSTRADEPVMLPISRDSHPMSGNRRGASLGCWWFVTRKYPPAVGGIERLSWEVTTRLGARRPLHVVAVHAQSLPIFVITSAWRLLYGCVMRRVSV